MVLEQFTTRIVLAPLAGGPSTPELTAAVSEAGACAFLAAGYLSAEEFGRRIEQTRSLTNLPFGVNLFVPGRPADPAVVIDYVARVGKVARAAELPVGQPRFEDDDWAAKLDAVVAARVPVVSFTFGCPHADVIGRLHEAGTEVWVTVTRPEEAQLAEAAGAHGLVVQGIEAGGHRGSFIDTGGTPSRAESALLPLLRSVRSVTALPLMAAGGIATGAAVAEVLAAGAVAAALGTAFLRCPDAGTNAAHRAALRGDAPTVLTRAFTGRLARGIPNRFIDELETFAPVAYPEIHHLTAPLRQSARERGDADWINLWAGESYRLGRDEPAADLIARLWNETLAAR